MSVPSLVRLSVWWHRKRNPGHRSLLWRDSVNGARGFLIGCNSCDREWT